MSSVVTPMGDVDSLGPFRRANGWSVVEQCHRLEATTIRHRPEPLGARIVAHQFGSVREPVVSIGARPKLLEAGQGVVHVPLLSPRLASVLVML